MAGGTFGEIASGVTATTLVDAGRTASTTYEYRVRAENAAGLSAFSNVATVTTPTAGTFTSADVNATPAGSTTVVADGSAYDITAGGADVYGTSDGFRYAYRAVTGDFDVKVQVQSFAGPTATSKAGLMARTSLDANSANVFSHVTPGGGYRFGRRATAGGTTTLVKTGTPSFPNAWVRLTRVGNVFTGYYSADGVNWTQTSSASQTMPGTVFLGMAVSANSTTQTATAQFRGLSMN